MTYRNPTPVAVGIVPLKDGLNGYYLGVVRGIAPVNGIAFPGGYVNEMESAEEAVCRELQEECGLTTTPAEWKPIATKVTPKNILLIFMELQREVSYSDLVDAFVQNEETKGLYIISRHTTLCFSTHEVMKAELFL